MRAILPTRIGTLPVRIVVLPIRIVVCLCFLLLSVGVAMCQQRSLPDAPSVTASKEVESLRVPAVPADTVQLSAVYTNGGSSHRDAEVLFGDFYRLQPVQQNGSQDFFQKRVYPTLLKRGIEYHPSSSGGLMSRTMYATSRLFLAPQDSGKSRLNTSYLLSTLASAAMQSAYRPYWRRSAAQPFSDFGATIGNDAGMNMLHEFGPGIRQLMKSHEPKFVTAIQEHLHHN
jgi:hypothetical protein